MFVHVLKDIDGVPIEASDSPLINSNINQSGSNTQSEMVISPLQLSFLRSETNSDSQPSLPEESSQNSAAVQTQTSSGRPIERTEDSNSRADSEVR